MTSYAGITSQISTTIVDELPLFHVYSHYKLHKLAQMHPNVSLEQYTKKWSRSLQDLISAAKREKENPSIGACKKYLEANRIKMRALLDKYSAHRQVAEQIEKDIHIYEKAQKECLEILKEYKDDEKFRIAYCRLFEKCRSAEETMTLFDHLYTIFQANTDFIYADLCFFDKVVEKLATEPCVCVFAGRCPCSRGYPLPASLWL